MIFVCGTPRSGTTLTAAILDRHPELLGGGELHYYDSFGSEAFSDPKTRETDIEKLLGLYSKFSQFEDQERVDLHRRELAAALQTADNAGKALNTFMQTQAEFAGKKQWVNSTPRDIFQASRILGDFPDAKLVICLRDPHDFVASYKNRFKTTYAENKDRLRELYHPMTSAALWFATIRRARSVVAAHPKNTFILNYENLVTESEDTLLKLCEFLGVEYQDDLTQVTSQNSSYGQGETKGIFSTSIRQGASRLTRHEAALVEFFKSTEVARSFGYGAKFRFGNALAFAGHVPSAAIHMRKLAKLSSSNGRDESFVRYIARRIKN